METVSVMFLHSISDVSQPGLFNSDPNDHVYGIWRQIIREFNMAQLVCIFDKKSIKMKAIFESDLDLFQPKTSTFSTRTLILVHFKTVRYFS